MALTLGVDLVALARVLEELRFADFSGFSNDALVDLSDAAGSLPAAIEDELNRRDGYRVPHGAVVCDGGRTLILADGTRVPGPRALRVVWPPPRDPAATAPVGAVLPRGTDSEGPGPRPRTT